jgi:[protein-PII] uridylyltransferase
MSPAETETVAWLVRHHLVLSDFAQKRDISDAQTVANFAAIVRSPERLRLLLVMTEADIRAVGPGVFNGWKGQLLRQLYYEAEAVLLGGHDRLRRGQRVAAAQEALRLQLTDWPADEVERLIARHYDAYWLSADADTHAWHARLMRAADAEGQKLRLDSRIDSAHDVTEIVLYAQDHPGLFARVTGAFSVSGANILDAKVFTTADGMALDTFYVQDSTGHALTGADKLDRLAATLAKTLAGEVRPREMLARRKRGRQEDAFTVEPRVIVDNEASNTHTVLEINGRDRPGLLADLAWALYRGNLSIGAARIATYGELAVDVFYVKDLFGLKITNPSRLKLIEERLMAALARGQDKREDMAATKRRQDALVTR